MKSKVFPILHAFIHNSQSRARLDMARVLALFCFLVQPCVFLSFFKFVIRSKVPNIKRVFDFLNLSLANDGNLTIYILSV